jgi:hypothetical protein
MNGFRGTPGAPTGFRVARAPMNLGTCDGPFGGSLGIGVAAVAAAGSRRSAMTRSARGVRRS